MELLNTVDMPTWALCALINGDETGLSAEDSMVLEEWINEELDTSKGAPIFEPVAGEPEFFSTTPAFGLPCNCERVRIYIAV